MPLGNKGLGACAIGWVLVSACTGASTETLLSESEQIKANGVLSAMALESSDVESCKKVSTGYMMSSANPRKACMVAVIEKSGSVEACLTSRWSDYGVPFSATECLVTLSRYARDPSLCENMVDLRAKGICLGNVAWQNKKISLCTSQTSDQVKKSCQQIYSEVEDVAFRYVNALTDRPSDFYFGEDPYHPGAASGTPAYPNDAGYVEYRVHSRSNLYYVFYVLLKKNDLGQWRVVYFGDKPYPESLR